MVLFLHNRYRTTGGEERVVEDLLALVRSELGEPAELLTRDSAGIGRGAAAAALAAGGVRPGAVAAEVRRAGARVVHAHNLLPSFGWRALAAARSAGAAVVLHLHQYRLVCAIGVCFTGGEDCTRCHGRNTLPGIVRNCRGSRGEALAYGASLAMWQRRIAAAADVAVVPSRFAEGRLRELGAPLPARVRVLPPPVALPAEVGRGDGGYALVVSRLAPEKGVDVAIEACRRAGLPLRVAGDGPERARLETLAAGASVEFLGRIPSAELARERAGAAVALVPSRAAETFGLAAAEAMAAGVPVVASSVGALPELVTPDALVAAGDADALAAAARRFAGDREAGERGRERIRGLCSPAAVAVALDRIYDEASGAFELGGSRAAGTSPP